MTNSIKRSFLLLGFMAVFITSFIACDDSSATTTYTNKDLQYTIRYPSGWDVVEVDTTETKLVTTYRTRRGFISIRVIRNPNLLVQPAVDLYVELLKTKYENFNLLEHKRMQGTWDWYISYDFLDEYSRWFHGETYFKQVLTRLYKIDTIGEREKYDEYFFNQIVSTFKLVKE